MPPAGPLPGSSTQPAAISPPPDRARNLPPTSPSQDPLASNPLARPVAAPHTPLAQKGPRAINPLSVQATFPPASSTQDVQVPDSPERPPVSPITPVATIAQLARLDDHGQPIARPPLVSEEPEDALMNAAFNAAFNPTRQSLGNPAMGQSMQLAMNATLNQGPSGAPTHVASYGHGAGLAAAPAPPSSTTTNPNLLQQAPPPVPVSESENPDIMALRSAISILQMQRDRATRDMRTLARIKDAAIDDPEGWIEEIMHRRGLAPTERRVLDYVAPTAAQQMSDMSDLSALDPPSDESDEDEDEDEDEDPLAEEHHAASPSKKGNNAAPASDTSNTNKRKDSTIQIPPSPGTTTTLTNPSTTSSTPAAPQPKFPITPGNQNIFKMPAINWSKYHVVGEALDKLHEEQLRRPTLGDGQEDARFPGRAPEFHVAAPLYPDAQNVHPMETRRAGKRHSDGGPE